MCVCACACVRARAVSILCPVSLSWLATLHLPWLCLLINPYKLVSIAAVMNAISVDSLWRTMPSPLSCLGLSP